MGRAWRTVNDAPTALHADRLPQSEKLRDAIIEELGW